VFKVARRTRTTEFRFRGARRALPVKRAVLMSTSVSLLTGVLTFGGLQATAVNGPAGYTSVQRIHAGTATQTDSRGLKWTPDTKFAKGGEVREASEVRVIGTDDPQLYRSQRYGDFSYIIPVEDGTYRLQLSFAEVVSDVGPRSFTVRSGNRALLQRFVITDHVKNHQALVVWLTVTVTGGSLPLTFTSDEGEAAVAGIELLRSSAAGESQLPGWELLFADSFDTAAAPGQFLAKYPNWDAYETGWLDTSKRGSYDVNRLSVKNGVLDIGLGVDANGKPRSAVPYPLINGRGHKSESAQTYGRYEVRFRADAVKGYKTAFLLWPESEVWPRDGEIDFPEGGVDSTISAFMHRQDGTSGGDQDAFSSNATYESWQTATIEWSPNVVRFLLNGQVVGESTKRIPNTPMRWVLQTETCLDDCEIPADARGNVQIDYVKVWKYRP
jgi:hypothetical protein